MQGDKYAIDYNAPPQEIEVRVARRTLGRVYLKGKGIEVGAGTRPWPIPDVAECFYGDVLDEAALEAYFKSTGSVFNGHVDAQTYAGIPDRHYDFALSAHVIEHLINPLGAIENALRIVRDNGILIFALPDMRYTFDHTRPVTSLSHLVNDYRTGGEGSRIEACLEHIRYLHPQWATPIPDELQQIEAEKFVLAKFDTHFHTWTADSLGEMIDWIVSNFNAKIIHRQLVVNENIFVLQKLPSNFIRKLGMFKR